MFPLLKFIQDFFTDRISMFYHNSDHFPCSVCQDKRIPLLQKIIENHKICLYQGAVIPYLSISKLKNDIPIYCIWQNIINRKVDWQNVIKNDTMAQNIIDNIIVKQSIDKMIQRYYDLQTFFKD